jgi:hypothetical protein
MFDKEFKEAIKNLASSEKDKLIFRLLKRDLDLANRLYFELIDTETVDDKRAKMMLLVAKRTKQISERFYSVGDLLMDVRYISGDINEHVRITKDKFGEIALNLQMLIATLTLNKSKINKSDFSKNYTFYIYTIARTFKILLLIKALHEDYLLDFKDGLEKLGALILVNTDLMQLAIKNGLDINWLIHAEIPQNIVAIHKQLRADGFLK